MAEHIDAEVIVSPETFAELQQKLEAAGYRNLIKRGGVASVARAGDRVVINLGPIQLQPEPVMTPAEHIEAGLAEARHLIEKRREIAQAEERDPHALDHEQETARMEVEEADNVLAQVRRAQEEFQKLLHPEKVRG